MLLNVRVRVLGSSLLGLSLLQGPKDVGLH